MNGIDLRNYSLDYPARKAARIAQETPGRLCECGKLWEKHTMKERRLCRAEGHLHAT